MNPPHFSAANYFSWVAPLLWVPSQPCHSSTASSDATSFLPRWSVLLSQAQKSWRKHESSSVWSPSHSSFPPKACSSPELGVSQIHFVTVTAAKQIGWDYKELKIALRGVLVNIHLHLLWISAFLLNIAAYLEEIWRKTYKREQHSCIMYECHPNAEVVS